MSRTKRNNLVYTPDNKGIGRGDSFHYVVITRKNRDRRGGHIHRRWFETDTMKRYYRIQTRLSKYDQIKIGIGDHYDAQEDKGLIFDWRGYAEGSIERWREDLAAEEEAFWEEDYNEWKDPWNYLDDPYGYPEEFHEDIHYEYEEYD